MHLVGLIYLNKHCCFTSMYEGDIQGRIMHPFTTESWNYEKFK
jgi:hypothetical protein